MRFFLSPATDRPPGASWAMTMSYFEVTTTTAGTGTTHLYVSGGPTADTVSVSACLGVELLTWIPIVEGQRYGRAWRHAISDAYPRIGAMLTAGADADHSRMTMTAGHDPDDQLRKWTISLHLSDLALPPRVDESNAQTILFGERMSAAYATALRETLAALGEVTIDGLSKVDKDAPHRREFAKGVRQLQEWMPAIHRFQSG
jgi:hypothetical protein